MKLRWKILAGIFVVWLIYTVVIQQIAPPVKSDAAAAGYTDTLWLQTQMLEHSQKCENCIVPSEWYYSQNVLSPETAGLLDQLWITGVAIKDIAVFIAQYSSDASYRHTVHRQIDTLYTHRHEVAQLLKNETIALTNDLAGTEGNIRARYQSGRVVAEVAMLFVGVGEVAESLKAGTVLTKITRKVRLLRSAKIARIAAACPPCAELYRSAAKLRRNLLSQDNLPKIQQLLKDEWAASGKSWNAFIKDYDAHHIIPKELLETDALVFYYNNGGKFGFNSIENGMFLKKISVGGVHANHPSYNIELQKRLQNSFLQIERQNLPINIKLKLFDNQLRKIVKETKEQIIQQSINNKKRVNKIFL